MGRIIGAITVVLVLLIIVSTIIYLVRHRTRHEDKVAGLSVNGDLSARQEQRIVELIDDAYRIFSRLGVNGTEHEAFHDPEIIRESTRTAIAAWTTRYRKVLTK